ncbi:EAL domain-containing protein, partial [Herbaspirillum sp. HC18]
SRHALEQDLAGALERLEFHLVFQPQMRLDTCELTGFEALLRWKHPFRGIVSPGEFIPMAEENGRIVPVGEWVLRSACATAASWPGVAVAVNLSPVQFRSRGLVGMVTSALAEAGLAPQRLELEVTETALLDDSEATIEILHQLRALGVRVSLDDFG